MNTSLFRWIALPTLLLLVGCVHYDFDLTKPQQDATRISRTEDTLVKLDPLIYHFRNVDNVLVVRIFNPTPDPIQLQGDRSSAIDSQGEAHPLRAQLIPPGAFVKVLVPPPRPTAYDPGPRFGFGLGVIGRAGGAFGGLYDPVFAEPRTYTLYDASNNFYWDWPGNTTARLIFTFQRASRSFSDEFTFSKRKI